MFFHIHHTDVIVSHSFILIRHSRFTLQYWPMEMKRCSTKC